jgi:hypothetical protein
MNNGTDDIVRHCEGCGKSSDDVMLFSIVMPPEIPDRVLLCKSCLNIAVDNSTRKNQAKQNEDEARLD